MGPSGDMSVHPRLEERRRLESGQAPDRVVDLSGRRATVGVISGSNHGSRMRPPLPGGVAPSASENWSHVRPNASRTRSRASDPLLKHVRPMYAPVGAPNT